MAQHLEERFVTAFEQQDAVNGTWLPHVHNEAIAAFKTSGFPTRKSEAWKYTNITPIIRREYHSPEPQVADASGAPDFGAYVIVSVNGQLQMNGSTGLPPDVTVTHLTDERHADLTHTHVARYAHVATEPFTALNTAFLRDGVLVHVPADTVLDRPIHLVHVITSDQATLVQPRTLVIAEAHARVQVIQSNITQTSAPILINSVSEIAVGAHAHVDHLMLQSEGAQTSSVTNTSVYQERSSRFLNGVFTFGGELTRNNLSILPDAEDCETVMHGLFVARDKSHIDNNTLVDHAKPNCYSSEYYKGILDDDAIGVFNGKVLVRQDAQLTNAYQTNRSILLSDTARMFSKPALEIYADDVKCSHGATTGQLDQDALFYLRARGIHPDDARRLMLMSFAGDIIEQVPVDAMRGLLYDEVERMLR